MRKKIVFLTKDALHREYLPVYGNKYWRGKTPNIDELAAKGTVFQRYYTGAPSTFMSNMCMFTGLDAYKSEMKDYVVTHKRYEGQTLFDRASEMGYSCHIIWDEAWKSVFRAEAFYHVYGEKTNIHYIKDLRQGVGSHYIHEGFLTPDDTKTEQVYQMLEDMIKTIVSEDQVFLWLHMPHVINGRTGYGQDMDAFDHVAGILRKYFPDDAIYVSADHGNMNGERNKLGYGFDVYEPAVKIPLITPRMDGQAMIDDVVSNVDIGSIIFEEKIPKKEYIFSDSAFYAQPNRKLAIITNRFKYIYNKIDGTEELYDLYYDPRETCNIMRDYIYDIDRQVTAPLRELFFYPDWELAQKQREYFRAIKDGIWKTGSAKDELKATLKYKMKIHVYYKIKKWIIKFKSR